MSGFHFDEQAASRAANFIERTLYHVKGEWAGSPFILQPWQRNDIVRPLFGWKRDDGLRKYRQALIALPRKNAKSTLSAALALYLLFGDNEYGGEIYSAAGDKEQARLVFAVAKSMVETSPVLSKMAKVYKNAIEYPNLDSVYKAISADAYTKHGFNASGIVFDELHTQPNRELYDVLATSMGARRQPLMIMLTTAGYGSTGIAREVWSYAEGVQRGAIIDDSFFPYIAAADPTDDWTAPKVWAKANPGLGVTIKEEYLQEQCERAKQIPASQNTFKRLHLNIWTSQESRWMDSGAWDSCNAPLPDLSGRVCYGGLDLASTTDIAAFVLAFPPAEDKEPTYVLPFFYIPEQGMAERSRKDRVPYDAWARDGYMIATPGNVIDYDFIYEHIMERSQQYKIVDIGFDRWGATQLSTKLQDAGVQVAQMGQGFASMSAPTKELMRLIMAQKIAHAGNPVLRWMAENVVVVSDSAGNIKLDKGKSREKIDGMVALVMAVDRMVRHASGKPAESIYEQRGVRVI